MGRGEVYRLELLPPGARPRRCEPLRFEAVEIFRHLDCHFYSGCLAFAARIPWPGFSCTGCPRFPAQPPPRTGQSEDNREREPTPRRLEAG